MNFTNYKKQYTIQLFFSLDKCVGYFISKNDVQKLVHWEFFLSPQEAIDLAQSRIEGLIQEEIDKYGLQLTLEL
jgi:hypothetical protein